MTRWGQTIYKAKSRRLAGFTLIELLVVITIIGILIALVVVTIGPIQQRSRDSKRKSDVNLLLSGANQFYADFKVYPNYTMYLGSNTTDAGAVNSSYDLGGDVSACAVTNLGMAGDPANFTTDNTTNRTLITGQANLATAANYNSYILKPGFAAVNNFLMCLKYMNKSVADPNQSGANGYQYYVSYDYSSILVSSTTENVNDKDAVTQLFSDGYTYTNKRYFEGNGKTIRQFDEDTNTNKFYTTGVATGGADGRYLYQCWNNAAGAAVNRDDRATLTYNPLVISGLSYATNPSCQQTTTETNVGVASF
ncbi:MAG TPA: type II secretion system protein [Candidatus Saccharimonadales bacterium]|nr:type II secretion system protein [Candidatus Saccharimonadales bacterium]